MAIYPYAIHGYCHAYELDVIITASTAKYTAIMYP